MQLALDVRMKSTGMSVPCWKRQILTGDQFDGEIKRLSFNWLLCVNVIAQSTKIPLWLQDPAFFTGKHSFIQHHTLVPRLPIQCYHLRTLPPKEGGFDIGRIDAETRREDAHQIIAVVLEKRIVAFFMHINYLLLRQREDMRRY